MNNENIKAQRFLADKEEKISERIKKGENESVLSDMLEKIAFILGNVKAEPENAIKYLTAFKNDIAETPEELAEIENIIHSSQNDNKAKFVNYDDVSADDLRNINFYVKIFSDLADIEAQECENKLLYRADCINQKLPKGSIKINKTDVRNNIKTARKNFGAVSGTSTGFPDIRVTINGISLRGKYRIGGELVPEDIYTNYVDLIKGDKKLDHMRFNDFSHTYEFVNSPIIEGKTGALSKDAVLSVMEYTGRNYGLADEKHVKDALMRACAKDRYNPVIEYIEAIEWDGIKRIETFMTKWQRAGQSRYTEFVLRRTMFNILERVYKPGCNVRGMMVLICPEQNTGKTTFARMLALKDEYFYNVTKLPRNMKDLYENMRGKLIVLFDEMSAFDGQEMSILKAELTKTQDTYRKPYAVDSETFKRNCSFIGTSNNADCLMRDLTGNTRFLPLIVAPAETGSMWDEDEMRKDVEQLYAEALIEYKAGTLDIVPDQELKEEILQMQESCTPDDNEYNALIYCIEEEIRKINSGLMFQHYFNIKVAYILVNKISGSGMDPACIEMSVSEQRKYTRYLDSCKYLRRYSGAVNNKCAFAYGGYQHPRNKSWEIKPEYITRPIKGNVVSHNFSGTGVPDEFMEHFEETNETF